MEEAMCARFGIQASHFASFERQLHARIMSPTSKASSAQLHVLSIVTLAPQLQIARLAEIHCIVRCLGLVCLQASVALEHTFSTMEDLPLGVNAEVIDYHIFSLTIPWYLCVPFLSPSLFLLSRLKMF